MAKVNGVATQLSGKVGQLIYRQTKYGTVVYEARKTSVPQRTEAQMQVRTQWGNLAAVYKQFNQTLKVLPLSEKVLSQQLKELVRDGLVRRTVNPDAYPPTTDYELTEEGERLIPALDMLYVWSMRQMSDRNIPIDADAFVVHAAEKYVRELKDIMPPDELLHGRKRKGSRKGK